MKNSDAKGVDANGAERAAKSERSGVSLAGCRGPRHSIDVERYELFESPRYRFDLERRAFMQIFAAMGGGLLVVASMPGAETAAQESGRGGQGGRASPDLKAWLHIDERGRITAFTGKTEIGQNIRTSLTQAVADELAVAMDAVTLVMADTDLTPFDAGTFGSLTTPRMAPQLAGAAATARQLLLAEAGKKWNVEPATLTVREGRVHGSDGRSAGYGELTAALTGTVAQSRVASPEAWTQRGKPIKKVDGRAFVTGRHAYTPDLVRPGMLHGRVVRPDGYVGTLVSLDDARATTMPGVQVVRDADFAGVVAPNERILRRAVGALRVEWRVPQDQPTSDSIYDHLRKAPPAAASGGRGGSAPFTAGDVAAVRGKATKTFDATYRIPYIAHVPLEPRAAVAEWTDGKLTVWCGTQRPFGVRSELASAFRVPEERVRVIVPDTGSAYGGKHSASTRSKRPASPKRRGSR